MTTFFSVFCPRANHKPTNNSKQQRETNGYPSTGGQQIASLQTVYLKIFLRPADRNEFREQYNYCRFNGIRGIPSNAIRVHLLIFGGKKNDFFFFFTLHRVLDLWIRFWTFSGGTDDFVDYAGSRKHWTKTQIYDKYCNFVQVKRRTLFFNLY